MIYTYSNVNYFSLQGYKKTKAYIGAQGRGYSVSVDTRDASVTIETGPMPNTVDDFWRMIWEKKLPTVVMFTRCFEGRVCPEKSKQHGLLL